MLWNREKELPKICTWKEVNKHWFSNIEVRWVNEIENNAGLNGAILYIEEKVREIKNIKDIKSFSQQSF